MYRPRAFQEDRLEVLHGLIREHPFAIIVTNGPAGLLATHAPMELDADAGPRGTLVGHLSRANPQWEEMHASQETLVVFQGPQAYISPSWYPSKQEHGRVVPTWDYIAVHAWGRAQTFDDAESLRAVLDSLTDHHERGRPKPWAVSDAPDDFVDGAMKAIVGFRIEIGRIEGQWKVSQNRSSEDRRGVIEGLQSGDEQARGIAASIPPPDKKS